MSHSTFNLPTVNKSTLARNRTFTLIEMLVVVVIIGILAVTLVPRLVGARERASDSGRIVKIGQISSAVELYAQENGSGTYPLAPLSDTPTSVATPSVSSLISPYLTTIPTDPGKGTVAIYNGGGNIMVTGDSFAYWTDTGGTVYAITALMESKKGNTTNAVGVVDKDKEGGYQVVGKGLITNIVAGGGGGAEPTEAGVYHDVANQEIIVTNGTITYVIQDKNVGASVAGTDHTNPAIRGAFFQRGNNHPFSSTVNETITPNSTTQVDTDGLNTYTDGTWIYGNLDWSIATNNNLRSDATQWKGPCGDGYHVPTYDEWKGLVNLRSSLPVKSTSKGDGYAEFNTDLFGTDLLLPKAGYRGYGSAESVHYQGSYGFYWSSTPSDARAYGLSFDSSYVDAYANNRVDGFSVRCFKNSY